MAQIEFRTSEDGQPVAFQVGTGALPIEPTQEPEVAASMPSRRARRKGSGPSSLEVGRA